MNETMLITYITEVLKNHNIIGVVKVNNRLARSFARTICIRNLVTGEGTISIEFNKNFKERPLESVINTVRHEVAHAITFIRYNETGHGKTWQKVCKETLCNGKVCSDF